MNTRLDWKEVWPTLVGLGGAFLAALGIGYYVMQAPMPDLRALFLFLVTSSLPSLVAGYLIFIAGWRWLGSIRQKMLLAYGLGVTIAIINIYVTSQLMFLSNHDFLLLSLLLIFAGILSISFGYLLAARMARSLRLLQKGAQRIAMGDLSTRVRLAEADELADVAEAFNTMAGELERSFARQRELEEARRNLIAAVSHDLRTPLTSIRAMIEALADGVVEEQATVRRYYTTIHSQIENLSGLIDDLFELSQLEAGQVQLRREAVNLNDLVSDTVQSMQAQAAAKGVSLQAEFDAGTPVVKAESGKIQRALFNLVQNAIRHTPSGGRVALKIRQIDGGVQVDVIDNGEGIQPEDLPYVFEQFYRGEKSRSRETGGAGLGLAVVKGVIEAHHGRIWVHSQAGQGTEFSFILPA